jgi:hypothetical protein
MGGSKSKAAIKKEELRALCTEFSRIPLDESIFTNHKLNELQNRLCKTLEHYKKPQDDICCIEKNGIWYMVAIQSCHPRTPFLPGRYYDMDVYDDGSMNITWCVRHNWHIGKFTVHPKQVSPQLKESLLQFKPATV